MKKLPFVERPFIKAVDASYPLAFFVTVGEMLGFLPALWSLTATQPTLLDLALGSGVFSIALVLNTLLISAIRAWHQN